MNEYSESGRSETSDEDCTVHSNVFQSSRFPKILIHFIEIFIKTFSPSSIFAFLLSSFDPLKHKFGCILNTFCYFYLSLFMVDLLI